MKSKARQPATAATAWAPPIDLEPYRPELRVIAANAGVRRSMWASFERAVDVYVRARLLPPPPPAAVRERFEAIEAAAAELRRLLLPLRPGAGDVYRSTRTKMQQAHPQVLADAEHALQALEPLSRWPRSLTRAPHDLDPDSRDGRPPSPARALVESFARMVPTEDQLRQSLRELAMVLTSIQQQHDTPSLALGDVARLVREHRK